MSSLSPYAYNEEPDDLISGTSKIEQVKKKRAKTQKKRYVNDSTDFDKIKVNNVIKSLHHNLDLDSDSGGDIGDFYPPPRAESTLGVGLIEPKLEFPPSIREKMSGADPMPQLPNYNKEGMTVDMSGVLGDNEEHHQPQYPQPMSSWQNSSTETNQSKYNAQQNASWNSQSFSTHAAPSKSFTPNTPSLPVNSSNDVLLQKINYMVHLLEEQKDQKTNNVTEEVILYSFLGIFIIFVADSFSKVGKYVR